MRTYKILIVENDHDFTFILQKWISQPSYELTVVNSAEEAKVLIDSTKWDLIISDVNLPKGSGIELLTNSKSKNSECLITRKV